MLLHINTCFISDMFCEKGMMYTLLFLVLLASVHMVDGDIYKQQYIRKFSKLNIFRTQLLQEN